MTSIRDTVTLAIAKNGHDLGSNTEVVTEDIATALEEREERIVASLRAYATDQGLDAAEADRALTTVGLIEAPQPSNGDGADGLAAQVQNLTQLVEQLQAAARNAGISV